MIKVIDNNKPVRPVIKMGEMKPCQIGRIINTSFAGNIVMRTFSTGSFEVMDLSDPGPDSCWFIKQNTNQIKVELFNPGEVIHLEISNEATN